MRLRWWNPRRLYTSNRSRERLWSIPHRIGSYPWALSYSRGGYCCPARLCSGTCRSCWRSSALKKCWWTPSKIPSFPSSSSCQAWICPYRGRGPCLAWCLPWVFWRTSICYTAKAVSWRLQLPRKCGHTHSFAASYSFFYRYSYRYRGRRSTLGQRTVSCPWTSAQQCFSIGRPRFIKAYMIRC